MAGGGARAGARHRPPLAEIPPSPLKTPSGMVRISMVPLSCKKVRTIKCAGPEGRSEVCQTRKVLRHKLFRECQRDRRSRAIVRFYATRSASLFVYSSVRTASQALFARRAGPGPGRPARCVPAHIERRRGSSRPWPRSAASTSLFAAVSRSARHAAPTSSRSGRTRSNEPCAPRAQNSRANNGGMDIVGDYRSRRMRKQGLSFREIATRTRTSSTQVRRALREAQGGAMRREVRAEIRKAGGLHGWWRS